MTKKEVFKKITTTQRQINNELLAQNSLHQIQVIEKINYPLRGRMTVISGPGIAFIICNVNRCRYNLTMSN